MTRDLGPYTPDRHTAVQVIEIMPPGVQTGLRDGRVHEPDAMPLDEYIAETMALLTAEPEATEIVVDATKPLRFAEPTACTSSAIPTSTRHARPDRRRRCVGGGTGRWGQRTAAGEGWVFGIPPERGESGNCSAGGATGGRGEVGHPTQDPRCAPRHHLDGAIRAAHPGSRAGGGR